MFTLPFSKIHVLFKMQFGFWNNHLTKHALVSLVEIIKKYLDWLLHMCHFHWSAISIWYCQSQHSFCKAWALWRPWTSKLLFTIFCYCTNWKQCVSISGCSFQVKIFFAVFPNNQYILPWIFLVYFNIFWIVVPKSIRPNFADDNYLLFPSKLLGIIESVMNLRFQWPYWWFIFWI